VSDMKLIFDQTPYRIVEHSKLMAMRCYVCERTVVMGMKDCDGRSCPLCGGPLLPVGPVAPVGITQEGSPKHRAAVNELLRMMDGEGDSESNGVVTVAINGYLWIYTLTEEQTEKMMAPLEDNIVHFTRISPGKDHTVFGCSMCKCRNAPTGAESEGFHD